MGFPFRVLSFNIRHYWADDGEDSWDTRAPAIVEILQKYRAEVICFQEVNLPVFEFLSQALEGYALASDQEDRGPRWEFRPIYVREPWRVRGLETISLSKTPDEPSKSWGSNFIRQATRAVLERDGVSLAVYDTHLDFQEEVQLNQVGVIWQKIQDQDLERPTVLAGDFNSTPDQRAYQFLTGRQGQGGLKGDFADSAGDSAAETFHGFDDDSEPVRIDWILYRGPGLRLTEPARTIMDRPQGQYPSDHYPLIAGFELAASER